MRCTLAFRLNPKSRESVKQRRRAYLCCLGRWSCMVVVGTYGLSADGTSGLTGSVVDDSGKPVAGARVLISRPPPSGTPRFIAPPVITGPLVATVVADVSGSFRADNLAPGQYIACAETTAPGFLDPCHWAASAPGFTVSAGQTTSGVKIVMAKGAALRVHVDDPRRLLKPTAG